MRRNIVSSRWGGRLAAIMAVWGVFAVNASAFFDESVAAQGLVRPEGGVVYVAAPAGATGQAIVRDLKVAEGDVLRRGELIATLVDQPLAEAAVDAARADAEAATRAVAVARANEAVLQARIEAVQAELALAQANVPAAEAAVAQAQAGVVEAQKARREALDKLDAAMAKLTGSNAAHQETLDEWDPPRRETEEIKFQQKMLVLELSELSASRPATVARLDAAEATAQAAVASAEAQAEAARAQAGAPANQIPVLQAQLVAAESETMRAQAFAQAAEAAIVQAEARLALTEVRAPRDGTVLHVAARSGEVVGPAGVVVIGDLSRLHVDAEIYIDDIHRVQPGQKVIVTGDAFEGELTGVVASVGQLVNPQGLFSSDPLAYTDKRVVTARVKLDPIKGWQPPVNAMVLVQIQADAATE